MAIRFVVEGLYDGLVLEAQAKEDAERMRRKAEAYSNAKSVILYGGGRSGGKAELTATEVRAREAEWFARMKAEFSRQYFDTIKLPAKPQRPAEPEKPRDLWGDRFGGLDL